METRDHKNSTLIFIGEENHGAGVPPKDEIRERIKIEFYKTYDVMTGIRIAATLGGFFSMMILLVLYKNYCKPSKTLSEEQLNAAVTAAAEEEDRALQAALEATSFYTSLEKRRQSFENAANQVLLSPRFSSVGGGYSHLAPPLRVSVWQQRGKSLPGSVLQFNSPNVPRTKIDTKINADDVSVSPEDEFYNRLPNLTDCKNYLNIFSSRRVSSVTCSSADSAYLERRCSAFEIGLPFSPNFLMKNSREKIIEKNKKEPWEFYYPIDIQVIQPTPEMSPTGSEKNLNDDSTMSGLKVPGNNENIHTLSVASFDIGLAPLASISSLGGYSQSTSIASQSLNTSSSNFPLDNHGATVDDSVGSDSVFLDLEDLSTDSEFEYDGFDDDYSFCECKKKTDTDDKIDVKNLKFASFDSYDGSITVDLKSKTNDNNESNEKFDDSTPRQQQTTENKQEKIHLKRYTSLHEGNKNRRKLIKTYSEPKVPKILPPWREKGRSGYVPKIQMSSSSSSPSKKKKTTVEKKENFINSPKESLENLEKKKFENDNNNKTELMRDSENDVTNKVVILPVPANTCSSSSSSSSCNINFASPNFQKSDSLSTSLLLTQGLKNDLPLKNQQQKTQKQFSLPSAKEKRTRWFQKQKNFIEDVKIGTQIKEKTDNNQSDDDDDDDDVCQMEKSTVAILKKNSEILLKPPNVPTNNVTGSCENLSVNRKKI